MKKNVRNSLFKKAAAVLLSLTMILAGVCFVPTKAGKSQAAGEAVDYYWTETFTNVVDYKAAQTAPKPSDVEHRDWLFAGWYTDQNCTDVLGSDEASGVAKFVPAGLMSVKCQVLSGTSKENPSGSLRVVSTVDSLSYQKVGFDIKVGTGTKTYESNTVYRGINAYENMAAVGYTPTDFQPEAKYFLTTTLTGIPQNTVGASTGILITPWWVTPDGTKVEGIARYARVNDSYDGIYNVPIRLYSDEQVVAGCLDVAYDPDVFTYVGEDIGTVFSEMEVYDKNGVIRCVGNVEKITSTSGNVKADGLYVNLRFQKVGTDVTVPDENTFAVSGISFCDYLQELKNSMYIPDGLYKIITAAQ